MQLNFVNNRLPRTAQEDAIDIFIASFRQLESYANYLTSEEYARSLTFHQPLQQQQWRQARCFLRSILALYTNTSPAEIMLARNKYGKLSLINQELYFSLAHTEAHVAVAVAKLPVGIDIEEHDSSLSDTDMKRIVQKFFTASQQSRFARASNTPEAFYTAWVETEARIKCHGTRLEYMNSRQHASPALVFYPTSRTYGAVAWQD